MLKYWFRFHHFHYSLRWLTWFYESVRERNQKMVRFAVNIDSCSLPNNKLILQKFLRKYDNIYLTINKQVDKTSEEMDSFSMHIQLHLLLFQRRKIERAMQNLCFRFCSKCVNMADIYALWKKKIKVRWHGPKFNAIWNFFSKCVIYPSAL